jgi:hypothetical protein
MIQSASEIPNNKLGRNLTIQLTDHFTPEMLDLAIDRTARSVRAVVKMFTAAPVDCWNGRFVDGECAAVEFAVELFVPPLLVEQFDRELEGQLQRLSPEYVASRTRGLFAMFQAVPFISIDWLRGAANCPNVIHAGQAIVNILAGYFSKLISAGARVELIVNW